jgi:pimeloyl-ACP methyl ester carboxylesterase
MTGTLHVVDCGSGPAVVLLHAFPCAGAMWEPQAASLVDAGFRVLVPDLPGFGASPLPEAGPSLDAVAATLIAMIDEREAGPCILGGVSLGGYLVMAILRARPDLARGVMLCGTKATADGDDARASRERLARMVMDAPDDTGRILEQAVLPGLLGETTRTSRPAVVEQVRGWLADAQAESVAWYQRAMAARPDSRPVLAGLAAPALVVWGVEDTLSPRVEQDLMVERLAIGEFAVIEDAGHLAGVERPDAVAEAVGRFAEQVRDRRRS